jgi:hypothetical protein
MSVSETILIILIIAFVGFVICGVTYNYFWQRAMARKGHCGLPWKSFDTDSGGAIGTKCQKCGKFGPWFDWYKKGISRGRIKIASK